MMPFETDVVGTAFFYILLRDHIQPGVFEEVVAEMERGMTGQTPSRYVLSNVYIGSYAEAIVSRLDALQRKVYASQEDGELVAEGLVTNGQ